MTKSHNDELINHFTHTNTDLIDNIAETITLDADSVIWLATRFSGLARYGDAIITSTQPDLLKNIALSVFPNPAKDRVNIMLNHLPSQELTIKIFDVHKNLVAQQKHDGSYSNQQTISNLHNYLTFSN